MSFFLIPLQQACVCGKSSNTLWYLYFSSRINKERNKKGWWGQRVYLCYFPQVEKFWGFWRATCNLVSSTNTRTSTSTTWWYIWSSFPMVSGCWIGDWSCCLVKTSLASSWTHIACNCICSIISRRRWWTNAPRLVDSGVWFNIVWTCSTTSESLAYELAAGGSVTRSALPR